MDFRYAQSAEIRAFQSYIDRILKPAPEKNTTKSNNSTQAAKALLAKGIKGRGRKS